MRAEVKSKKAGERPPDTPEMVVRRMREHNRLIHNADSALIDWNCKACEKIQEEHAASITYHQPHLTSEGK